MASAGARTVVCVAWLVATVTGGAIGAHNNKWRLTLCVVVLFYAVPFLLATIDRAVRNRPLVEEKEPFLAAISFLITVTVATVVFVLARRARLRKWPSCAYPRRCRRCNYNLTGLSSNRCPECGTPIPSVES